MILTIITLIAIVVGIAMSMKNNDIIMEIGMVMFVLSAIAGFVMVCFIIGAHVGVDAQIEENRIEYESLCERQEIANSDYEDVSKSDVIKDVAEWNKMVYRSKHWAYNPWTSWFYSKKVVDELEMIERRQNVQGKTVQIQSKYSL